MWRSFLLLSVEASFLSLLSLMVILDAYWLLGGAFPSLIPFDWRSSGSGCY